MIYVIWLAEKLIVAFLLILPKTEIIAKLILAECGGKINILDFKDSRIFICTNKFIEKTVKQMIENNIIKS